MTIKDLGLREWLVVIFIALGLGAFALEDHFKPKIYEAQATVQGFNMDEVPINMTVKAYKKSNGELRVTEIITQHEETPEIGAIAIQKLIDDVKARQKFDNIDVIAGATVSSNAFKEGLNLTLEDIKNQK